MTARGSLRIYLGAAPGVGKTFAMLDEGHRRAARGTDVVVACVETHGRARTEEKLAGLKVIPRREITCRGTQITEMDPLTPRYRPGDGHASACVRRARTASQIIHARLKAQASRISVVCVPERPSEPTTQPCAR